MRKTPRTRLIAAAGLLALAGCGTWTHPSKPAAALDADRMGCEQQAVALYPVVLVQRQTAPARQEPPKTTCTTQDGKTLCTTVPGAWTGPRFVTEDANSGRRDESISQCLRALGWVWKAD